MNKQTIPYRLLVGLLVLVTTSCSLTSPHPWPTSGFTVTPATRDFELEGLLIGASVFPSHWHLDGPAKEHPDEVKPRNVEKDLYVQFGRSNPPGRATHAVYRFQDSAAAAKGYRQISNMWFYSADLTKPWEAPDWMQYQSSVADQFRFACADFYGGYPKVRSRDCVAIGQYKVYISVFSLSVSPPENMVGHIMLLGQILQAIDKRMELDFAD